MAFETQLKVRFHDVDRAGIAFYPTIVRYLHEAFEDFFEGCLGISYARVLDQDLGFPAVDLRATFHRPLRFGERLTVAVSILRIGRSSMEWLYRIQDAAGALRVEARVTVVCTRMSTLQALPIPEAQRRGFSRFLEPEARR